MRFTEKGKIFEFLNYNAFYKEKIHKLLNIERDNCVSYLITFQFIGDFGEIVTATHKIYDITIDNFLKGLEADNHKFKFNK